MAEQGSTVSVHYTGTLDNGSEFDSSRGASPLPFTIGDGRLIPGFAQAVIGMSIGQVRTVRIEPEDAYGKRDEALIFDFPRSEAPAGLQEGARVSMADGSPATVLEITNDVVRIDFNHPLAGEALTFEIELVSIN